MDFLGEKAAVNIVSFTVFKGNLLSLPQRISAPTRCKAVGDAIRTCAV